MSPASSCAHHSWACASEDGRLPSSNFSTGMVTSAIGLPSSDFATNPEEAKEQQAHRQNYQPNRQANELIGICEVNVMMPALVVEEQRKDGQKGREKERSK